MTVTFNMAHQSGMYIDFRVFDVFYIDKMCSISTTHQSWVNDVNLT